MWRRAVIEEIRRIEDELSRIPEAAGNADDAPARRRDLELAGENLTWACRMLPGPRRGARRLGGLARDLACVWTGAESETAWVALHRADEALLMVADTTWVREEALKMQATLDLAEFKTGDPRPEAYNQLFARIADTRPQGADVARQDRESLRSIRAELHRALELSRAKVRIFRNILTGTILVLVLVLVIFALLGRADPSGLNLRSTDTTTGSTTGSATSPAATTAATGQAVTPAPAPRTGDAAPKPGDIAEVELLGAFGGLLSSVTGLRSLRNYQRSYGLPLAQAILKLPVGAAAALVAVLLLQHGILTTVNPQPWRVVVPEAILFGVAQIAVTRAVDNRSADLIGDVEAKASATHPRAPARAGGFAASK
jgi:hypothetical protein